MTKYTDIFDVLFAMVINENIQWVIIKNGFACQGVNAEMGDFGFVW
jgi:hypothetical protein